MAHATQLGPGMGKPRNGDPGQSTRTRVGTLMVVTSVREPRDPMAVPMVSPVSHANGEPGSHAGIGHRDEPSSCWM